MSIFVLLITLHRDFWQDFIYQELKNIVKRVPAGDAKWAILYFLQAHSS